MRKVLFFGKSMSRTRCTGALVDALRRHGLEVRWRNLAKSRRLFGAQLAHKLCRAEFERYKPDVVFVFLRDLPMALAAEFRRSARLVIWCEELMSVVDAATMSYFRQADVLCMSNAARFAQLREHGLDNMAFLMSGFSPRYHWPPKRARFVRDVAYIGGPGQAGQRADLLRRVAEDFDVHVFGGAWQKWTAPTGKLHVHGSVKNRAYARVCASSRIVLGINEANDQELYCSNRTFLSLACGAFHLTHHVPGLDRVFRDGEHLAYFHDEVDALEKIAAWLPRDEERARIAASGHSEVMQYHQYYHRVARILHWLEHGLPRDDRSLLSTDASASRAASPSIDA